MTKPYQLNAASLRRRILARFAPGVPGAAASLDRKSNKFLAANGGWAVTRQDIMFPLALLYTTPGTKHHRSPAVLDLATRGGDGLHGMQGPAGDWEFVKVDGSSWGRVFMPWSIYHWLETFALLRDSLGRDRLERWTRGLTLACDGVAREIARPLLHNIPCWKGMSLVRAGDIFDRADWREIGIKQIHHVAAHQRHDGYWPEGDGPTSHYNLVYVHAIGLYYAFTRDADVLPALERAAAFHAAFTYPDGTCVETVDGRVRYTFESSVTGLPGLCVTPEGRAVAQCVIEHATRDVETDDNAALSPQLASAFQHLREGDTATTPATAASARVVHGGHALTLRKRPWFATVSGYVPATDARHEIARNRWIMTRSNLLSVYHDKFGLLIGGGNSKYDPSFATFEVTLEGVSQIEPDAVTFSRRGASEVATFRYGRHACVLRLTPKSAKRIDIAFEIPPATAKRCQVTGRFTFRVAQGDRVRWRSGGRQPADSSTTIDPRHAVQFFWTPEHGYRDCTLEGKRWKLSMPLGSGMYYPAYPFNPYAIDNAAPAKDALMSLFAQLGPSRAAMFSLSLR